MIVPVVLTMETYGNDYEHLTVFYRYLSVLQKHEKRAIIAHERYFMSISEAEAVGYTKKELQPFCDLVECDLPSDEFLENVGHYFIPQCLENEIIDKFDCQLSAWTSLLKENNFLLEEWLGNLLDQIKQDYEERIEAILCVYAPIALRIAAEKRGIAVIHQEMSMFRPPVYRKTGYFDFKESYGFGELEDRFSIFFEEHKQKPLPILERKEILAMFMLPEFFKDIHLMDAVPQYEVGIGLYSASTGMLLKYGAITTSEIRLHAYRRFSAEQVLCRDRLKDPRYDQSPSSYHFITKCKRIAGLRSNLLFEAMLLNRVACIYGASPFKLMGTKGLKDTEDKIATLEFVNFTTFGYFVPWELMTDWEYIRFRLSKPSETEIYLRHLNHYLDCGNISLEILDSAEDRLNQLLCARGVSLSEIFKQMELPQQESPQEQINNASVDYTIYEDLRSAYFNLEDYSRTLRSGYGNLEETYKQLQGEYSNLEEAYKQLQGGYGNLEETYKQLLGSYTGLEEVYQGLQTEYLNLQDRVQALEQQNKSKNRTFKSFFGK